jgi:predicted RND superfamily exporter protein
VTRIIELLARFIVDRPLVVTLLLGLWTGVVLVGYVAPHVVRDWVASWTTTPDASLGPENGPREASELPDVEPFSLGRADVVLVIQGDSFFSEAGATTLREVVAKLEALDHVHAVTWMDRVPILNIFGLPEPLLPRSDSSASRFEASRDKALKHPLVAGHLLSSDGKTVLMLVELDWFFVDSDDECTEEVKQVAVDVCRDRGVDYSVMMTGRVPSYLTAIETHEANQLRYQLLGYGTIALMSLFLFRGFTAVTILAMAPCVGVFWTLGVIRYFDYQDNPFNDVVLPILLALVGLTDGVHLMVTIRKLRVAGQTEKQAALNGVREVGLACALTSLTTGIGFGSLMLAHHEIVREFGQCCVMGVGLTFVSVITVIPLACATPFGRRVQIGHENGLIDRHLQKVTGLVDWVLARRTFVSSAAIVATLVCVCISSVLRPDERNSNALPPSSEAARALIHMDQSFGGLEQSNVTISWNEDVPEDSADVLGVVAEVDDLLRAEPLIGHPISLRNLVDALPGEGELAERASMIDLLPPPLKRAFYTPEHRQAQVLFRVQDLGIAAYGPVFTRVEKGLARLSFKYPGFQYELKGSAVRRWRNLYQIVIDLVASLGTATAVIFLVLSVAYRSLRVGLISVIPNVFPLAITGTYLVFTGQALELVSVCAFTVCLGIAVDDTIHFLTRFAEEHRATGDIDLAIRRSFTQVGTALIMTTMVLVAGFSTVLFSDFRDHRIFATMGTLTIVAALFGDLVFLPALLARFIKPLK